MANPPSDQGIPILTEVIGPQSTSENEPAASSATPRSALPATNPASTNAATTPTAQNSQASPMQPQVPRPSATPPATGGTASIQARPLFKPAPAAQSNLAGTTASQVTTPAVATPAQNSDIPVAKPAELSSTPSTPLPTSTASAAPEVTPVKTFADAAVPAVDTPQAGTWSDTELRDLENELRVRITRQVLGRIDFVLDHRVRNTVTEVVDAAIDTLAVEIKHGLHETLADIVARAVAQEISRLQSGKK